MTWFFPSRLNCTITSKLSGYAYMQVIIFALLVAIPLLSEILVTLSSKHPKMLTL